ncbi:hypothetical protein CDD82_5883 [Ophiocordyceps australis]|uniref:DNA polymerase kappa n=1 Tax=Ophiocordyceps australis TaxID=1399860 RepID=A0A2C5ZRK9_9HYPO|nr:hypothetical protein CDD82_5883 [Ophiocordyceps australis]
MATTRQRGSPELDEHRNDEAKSLKYQLLGPSLTKAGQEQVDQSKVGGTCSSDQYFNANKASSQVSEIIYQASKGSKFFNREQVRDQVLTKRIQQILDRKRLLDKTNLGRDLRNADRLLSELESSRDLTQYVVHIDCDAFYAAVEQLEKPELKDVPFAVGGGVLTTCNYAARQFGCRSGMAGFVAKKLCPELILVKPNFEKYTAKARQVRQIFAEYDARFESASIDEAYLNITEYCKQSGMEPCEAIEQMRRHIHQETNITVSAGIAANTKLAKICSNMNKPNGQYILTNNKMAIMTFMRDLPIRKVNGIGRVLERQLVEIGINTCGDIYQYRQYLNQLFGEKTFEFLLTCYLGLGRTRIQPAEDYERKSVGTESTFQEMSNATKLREKLQCIAQELEKDMRRAECKGRTLCLKVKLHSFEVLTRQVVPPHSVYTARDLYTYAVPMLARLEQEIPEMKLRLMGLRCTNLVSTKKPDTMAFFGFKQPKNTRVESEGHNDESHGGNIGMTAGTGCPVSTSHIAEDKMSDGSWDALGSNNEEAGEMVPQAIIKEPEREDWWQCPVCLRPQRADERIFNDHIDTCLSRQTIREAVHGGMASAEGASVTENAKSRGLEKRKARSPCVDPKQKRICFG